MFKDDTSKNLNLNCQINVCLLKFWNKLRRKEKVIIVL